MIRKLNWLSGSAMVACIVIAVAVALAVVVVYMFALQLSREGLESTREGLESTREGLENQAPLKVALKKQIEDTDTAYTELKNAVDDQTSRIQANAHMLLSLVRDMPNKTNSITHANVDMDDPSKTRIPNVTI